MNAKILSKLKDRTLFGLEGRTALITGGGQGIGLSIARGFAYAGANVSICDVNMETATQQSELLNRELNSNISIPIHADVSKSADIAQMIDRTVKEFGRMDIAVNNAGTQGQLVPFPVCRITHYVFEWARLMDFVCIQNVH